MQDMIGNNKLTEVPIIDLSGYVNNEPDTT